MHNRKDYMMRLSSNSTHAVQREFMMRKISKGYEVDAREARQKYYFQDSLVMFSFILNSIKIST